MNYINVIRENKWLALILVIAALLRLYHLDFQSPWLDEIHTLNEANPNLSFKEVYTSLMASEQMPPLYFYMIYFLFKFFGHKIFIARLLSAILGILSVYGVYKLGKELIDKKTGFIAAFLLTINSFHLYYSQDARPYILLLIFTIYSFYFLVKFLKDNNLKNAIYYSLFTGLMILTHFFGLFVLFSQMFIVLFFLILQNKDKKLNFFKLSLLAGIIILFLFLPALKIFIMVSEIKDFWIPIPTLNVYTSIFNEFFGNSEMILSLLGIFVLMYFIRLTKEKNDCFNYSEIIKNKIIFSFVIILPWIALVLLVPLIRSYLTVPMIISRYFIVTLPAILIIISIGILQFKIKTIRFSLLALLFVFSIIDIVIVKKIYTIPNKSQFRETSQFVIDNQDSKTPIYTTLSWYFKYFIPNHKIEDKPLNQLLDEIKSDTTKLKSFWYINAHGNKFELNEENKQFLNKNYVIDKNYEGLDAWAKRFVPQKSFKLKISVQKYFPFNKKEYGHSTKTWIEDFDFQNRNLKMKGWSILKNIDSKNYSIYVVIFNDKKEYSYLTTKQFRPDITNSLNDDYNYDNSGFEINTELNNIEKGNYRVGIYISNNLTNGFYITEKQILIN